MVLINSPMQYFFTHVVKFFWEGVSPFVKKLGVPKIWSPPTHMFGCQHLQVEVMNKLWLCQKLHHPLLGWQPQYLPYTHQKTRQQGSYTKFSKNRVWGLVYCGYLVHDKSCALRYIFWCWYILTIHLEALDLGTRDVFGMIACWMTNCIAIFKNF